MRKAAEDLLPCPLPIRGLTKWHCFVKKHGETEGNIPLNHYSILFYCNTFLLSFLMEGKCPKQVSSVHFNNGAASKAYVQGA